MRTLKQTKTIGVARLFSISVRALALISALIFSPAFATAQQTVDGDAVVEGAWARAAGKGRASAAYFTIRNTTSEPLRLIDVRSDLSSMVTLHKTDVDSNGVTRMSAVARVTIEPGAALTLEPGRMHAMMMDLEKPLIEGETFQLRLKFYDMDELVVEVPVLGIGARGPDG